MADEVALSLQTREVVGKQVRQLRRDGIVPAVIHDHGKPSVVVSAEYQPLAHAYKLAGKHHSVKLDAAGKKYTAMIKTVELDPRKNTIKHVVFNAVSANEKIQAEIPVKPRYAEDNDSTPAERASLIIINNTETVMVEAVASKLPDVLEYDAEKLVEIGDKVTAADLDIPAGVELKVEPETPLATVYEPAALAAANEEAAGDAEVTDEAAEENVPADNATTIQEAVVDEKLPGGKKELPEDGTQKTAQ